jgi:hypothetical protein
LEQPDAELVALGRQFDDLTEILDRGWPDDATFEKFSAIEKAILEREAVTVAGLSVKARAACWALLGDPIRRMSPQPTKEWRCRLFAI